MGIESFSTFLKKYAPQSYYEIPMESFRGKTIAIDMNNLMFIMMSTSIKEILSQTNLAESSPDRLLITQKTLDRILYRLEIFFQYGITPVCVFDGKAIPLKNHVKAKRNKSREQIKSKLAVAEKNLYSTDPLLRNQLLINEYEKYYKQDVNVDFNFIEQLKDILKTTGFVVLCAADFHLETNDAEALCASLCLPGNNYCYAAATTDSDFHTYGGNFAIIDIEMRYFVRDGYRVQMHYAMVRSLESILIQTDLTFDSFQDLCILMGTDFNPNIPNVGPVKSWDLIKRLGNIPTISQYKDVTILNYCEVKKVFSSTIAKIDIPEPKFNRALFREYARDVFERYGMRDHTTTINRLLDQSNIEVNMELPNSQISLLGKESEENLSSLTF